MEMKKISTSKLHSPAAGIPKHFESEISFIQQV